MPMPFPNMGVDYDQLAGMIQPTGGPMTPGVMSGMNYQRDMDLKRQFLMRAAADAERNSQLKGMEADEAMSPEAIEARGLERKGSKADNEMKLMKLRQLLESEESKPLIEAAQAFGNEGDLESAYAILKTKGIDKFKKHTFFEDSAKDTKLLSGVWRTINNEPKLFNKLQVEEKKNEGKIDTTAMKEAGATERANLKAKIDKYKADLMAAVANKKIDAVSAKQNLQQRVSELHQMYTKNGVTDWTSFNEAAGPLLQALKDIPSAPTVAKGEQQRRTLETVLDKTSPKSKPKKTDAKGNPLVIGQEYTFPDGSKHIYKGE